MLFRSKLEKKMEILKKELENEKQEKETVNFFDNFLEPMAVTGKELATAFQQKLGNPDQFSVDDVSLFLNSYGMGDVVAFQREKGLKGKDLLFYNSDPAEFGITDNLLGKKFTFFGELLENRLLGKAEILDQCPVWRHLDVEKTLLFLREREIELDQDVIRDKKISICQLMYFKGSELREFFGASVSLPTIKKLNDVKKEFSKFLEANQPSEDEL